MEASYPMVIVVPYFLKWIPWSEVLIDTSNLIVTPSQMPPKTATNEFVHHIAIILANLFLVTLIASNYHHHCTSTLQKVLTFVVFFGRGDCCKEKSITKSGGERMPPDGVLCALCIYRHRRG